MKRIIHNLWIIRVASRVFFWPKMLYSRAEVRERRVIPQKTRNSPLIFLGVFERSVPNIFMVFGGKTDKFSVFWFVYVPGPTHSKILLHQIQAYHMRKLKKLDKSCGKLRKSTFSTQNHGQRPLAAKPLIRNRNRSQILIQDSWFTLKTLK